MRSPVAPPDAGRSVPVATARRVLRSAAVTVGAGALAAGCAGSVGDFERAVDLAWEKSTVRVESEQVIVQHAPDGTQEQLSVVVAGGVDLQADRGELTMTFDGPGDEPDPMPCRMVMDEEADYLKVADESVWLRSDLGALQGEQTAVADPRESFEFLRAIIGDVEGVGFETVRGVETRHWRVHVDLDRLMDETGQAPAPGLRGGLKQQTLPIDVWIDDDGLPRRVAFTVKETVPGGTVELRSSTDLFAYGEPQTIELPDGAEVRGEPNVPAALLACMGQEVT